MANTASLIITLFFFSGFSLSCRVYGPARMPYCVSRAMRPAKWAMSPLRTIVALCFTGNGASEMGNESVEDNRSKGLPCGAHERYTFCTYDDYHRTFCLASSYKCAQCRYLWSPGVLRSSIRWSVNSTWPPLW